MKHIITALMIALIPGLASADAPKAPTKKIYCGFTEPFFSLEADLEKRTLTLTEPDWDNGGGEIITKIVATGISLKPDFSDPLYPRYVVLNSNGAVLLKLTLNMRGSDGMSNVIFPFEAEYGEHWGGCETEHIKSFDPSENE